MSTDNDLEDEHVCTVRGWTEAQVEAQVSRLVRERDTAEAERDQALADLRDLQARIDKVVDIINASTSNQARRRCGACDRPLPHSDAEARVCPVMN